MAWTVLLRDPKRIDKIVERLRPSTQAAYYEALEDLMKEGPSPKGWITEPLHGHLKGLMKLKLDYRHRMIYEVAANVLTITVIEVSTREGAYR